MSSSSKLGPASAKETAAHDIHGGDDTEAVLAQVHSSECAAKLMRHDGRAPQAEVANKQDDADDVDEEDDEEGQEDDERDKFMRVLRDPTQATFKTLDPSAKMRYRTWASARGGAQIGGLKRTKKRQSEGAPSSVLCQNPDRVRSSCFGPGGKASGKCTHCGAVAASLEGKKNEEKEEKKQKSLETKGRGARDADYEDEDDREDKGQEKEEQWGTRNIYAVTGRRSRAQPARLGDLQAAEVAMKEAAKARKAAANLQREAVGGFIPLDAISAVRVVAKGAKKKMGKKMKGKAEKSTMVQKKARNGDMMWVKKDTAGRGGQGRGKAGVSAGRSAENVLTNASSSYCGVAWDRHRQRWKCRATIGGKQLNLGYFVKERAAALAFDEAVRKGEGKLGQRAWINFPTEEEVEERERMEGKRQRHY